jgi:hypothetical protein
VTRQTRTLVAAVCVGWLLAAVAVSSGCWWLLTWLAADRVAEEQVVESIQASLPMGSPRGEVDAWVAARGIWNKRDMVNECGRPCLECWYTNTGSKLDLIPKDIRVRFYFGPDGDLTDYTVKTEDRF